MSCLCIFTWLLCICTFLLCIYMSLLWIYQNPVGRNISGGLTFGMGWLRLVGSLKLQVSFAKEPYKRDYILLKRPLFLKSPLIVAAPYSNNVKTSPRTTNSWRRVANSTQGQQGPSINLRILIGRTGDCDVDQFFWYVPDD